MEPETFRQIMRGVGRGLRPPRVNGANPGIQFWYNERKWRSPKELAQAFLPHLHHPPTDSAEKEKMVTDIQAQIKTWVREHPFEPPLNKIWLYNNDDGNDDDGNVPSPPRDGSGGGGGVAMRVRSSSENSEQDSNAEAAEAAEGAG